MAGSSIIILQLKSDRILISESIQPEIMEKIHYRHQGSDKCKLRAKICVF